MMLASAYGVVMPSQTINVFVSYSHADASLVAPVVRLLRVNRSLVFQDTDRILPGKKWRDEIAKALAESTLVVVFWCHHACRSDEVSKEWRTAIELDKDVLPLLLDATPLPSELGDFQWIDFRGTIGTNHGPVDTPIDDALSSAPPLPPMAASPRRAVWPIVAGVTAVLAVALSTSFWLLHPKSWSPPLSPGPPVNGLPPETEAAPDVLISWILLLLGIIGALGAWRLWLRYQRTKRATRIETSRPHPEDFEHRIAVELEAEILRRAASANDDRA
jgi:hypothetical protein